MKLRFGLFERKALTGAELAVRIYQISSLLPLPYLLIAAGSPPLITKSGLLSVLFDLGCMVLPRPELRALSLLYRLSASEIAVHFAILLPALIVGLAAERLLKNKRRGRLWRIAYAAWIGLDLLVRFLLPHLSFPLWAAVTGFAVRLSCLALILLDLRAARKS